MGRLLRSKTLWLVATLAVFVGGCSGPGAGLSAPNPNFHASTGTPGALAKGGKKPGGGVPAMMIAPGGMQANPNAGQPLQAGTRGGG